MARRHEHEPEHADLYPGATSDTVDRGLVLMGEVATVVHEWVAATRVRVHKRIVTEIQTIEVEVRREELVVTPEPLGEDEAYVIDVGHAPVQPEPRVFLLRAEVPAVTLSVLPVERVTLEVRTVREDQELTVALTSERVELIHEPALPPARNRPRSHTVIGLILTLLIVGLIAGFIARALVPGRDAMSVPRTIVLGIIGSFVGGFVGWLLHGGHTNGAFHASGLLGSIVGAVIALLVYNAVNGRKAIR